MTDDLDRLLAADDSPPHGAIAARVVVALPPRRRPRATVAALLGGIVAAVTAAWLAPAFASAIGDLITGDAARRADALILLTVPLATLLLVRRRQDG